MLFIYLTLHQYSEMEMTLLITDIFIGVCYGYQILDVHEGPNIPFSILRTRFRKVIILLFKLGLCLVMFVKLGFMCCTLNQF